MGPQKEQLRCLCGFSSDLCNEKHRSVDCKLIGIKEEISKSEERIKERIDTSEAHAIERITHQKEIVNSVIVSLNGSFKEGLEKLSEGLNSHRKLIEEQEERVKELEEKMPTKAISRVVKLENWQKKVTYVGLTLFFVFEIISNWGSKIVEFFKNSGGTP